MSKEVSLCYTCYCNNKNYPSQLSLKNHQKTKGHKQWVETNELKQLKISLTEKDNKILKLEKDIESLIDLNNLFIHRLHIQPLNTKENLINV